MINAFDFPNNTMKEILPIVIFHVDFLFACLFVGKVLYFSQYLGGKNERCKHDNAGWRPALFEL